VNAVVDLSASADSSDLRRHLRMDYFNALRRTPSASSSVALSAVDYRGWLTSGCRDDCSRVCTSVNALLPHETFRTLSGRFRSGTISSASFVDQEHLHDRQQRDGVTSVGAHCVNNTILRPFSTVRGRSGDSMDDNYGSFNACGADVSSVPTTCYTLPHRRRRELVWPSSAVDCPTNVESPSVEVVHVEQVSAAVAAAAGARVMHRNTPGIRCVISGDGSVVYRGAAPSGNWVRTKHQAGMSHHCERDLKPKQILSHGAPTGAIRWTNDDTNGNSAGAGKRHGPAVDTVV
jgi:hypothetical protein